MREPEARNRQYIYFLLASHKNISKLLPKTLLVLIQCDTYVTLCDMFMTCCDTLWQNNVWHYTFEKQRNCHKIVSIFCDLPHIQNISVKPVTTMSPHIFFLDPMRLLWRAIRLKILLKIIIQKWWFQCAWWGLVHWIKNVCVKLKWTFKKIQSQ